MKTPQPEILTHSEAHGKSWPSKKNKPAVVAKPLVLINKLQGQWPPLFARNKQRQWFTPGVELHGVTFTEANNIAGFGLVVAAKGFVLRRVPMQQGFCAAGGFMAVRAIELSGENISRVLIERYSSTSLGGQQ